MDIRITSGNGQDVLQHMEGVEEHQLQKGNFFKSNGKHFEVLSAEEGEDCLDVEVREITPAFHRTLFLMGTLAATWYAMQYALDLMQ